MTPGEQNVSEVEYYAFKRRQADLADLREHWGDAYRIGWQHGEHGGWWAKRPDDNKVLRAATAGDLREAIHADYGARPVPRDLPAT